MTIIVWRILTLASGVLFVAGLIALFCLRLLKNRYFHEYTEDELMRTVKTTNSKNFIYFTSGETKKYIKKYVVCKSAYDNYLVCNFARHYSIIRYYVVEYTAAKRVLAVQQVVEYQTGDSSKVIALHRRCRYVNVVAGRVEGLEINSNVIRPVSLSKIRLYAFLTSALLFLGLFVVRHFALELLLKTQMKFYLVNALNYVAVGASLLLSLIGYFITVKCFRGKNAKGKRGGALEYEFV